MDVIVNQIRCKICDDVISSNYTHDYKRCACGAVSTDGGREYQRLSWSPRGEEQDVDHYIDTTLSTYKKFSETSFQIDDVIKIVKEVNEQIKELKQNDDVHKAIHYERQLKGHLAQIILLKKEMNEKEESPDE